MWNFMKSCFTILICSMEISEAIRLAPIYWNSSNTIFKSSTSPEPIQAKLEYNVDLECPYYEKKEAIQMETYIIYLVSKDEYDKCDLRDLRYMLLNCSTPLARRRSTLMFLSIQPIPYAPEYKEGQTYYIMTTSTGRLDGLSNRVHGACQTQNMRLSFYIQPSVTFQEPQTPKPDDIDPKGASNPWTNRVTATEKPQTTPKPVRKLSSHTYPATNTLQQTQTNSKQFQGSGGTSVASFTHATHEPLRATVILLIIITLGYLYNRRLWSTAI